MRGRGSLSLPSCAEACCVLHTKVPALNRKSPSLKWRPETFQSLFPETETFSNHYSSLQLQSGMPEKLRKKSAKQGPPPKRLQTQIVKKNRLLCASPKIKWTPWRKCHGGTQSWRCFDRDTRENARKWGTFSFSGKQLSHTVSQVQHTWKLRTLSTKKTAPSKTGQTFPACESFGLHIRILSAQAFSRLHGLLE